MMEIREAKTIVSDCERVKERINDAVENHFHFLNNEQKKKIKDLEFFLNELTIRKENLTYEINLMASIKTRVEQTVKSLQYPKETCLKCFEIRKSVADLYTDEVQKELQAEIQLIENTQKFFNSLLHDLQEQLRKDRSKIYGLEEDIQRKKKALRIEKQNEKINNSEICSGRKDDYETISKIPKNLRNRDWLYDTNKILETAKYEYEMGQKLKLLVEESLSLKTVELINQHDRCNEKFSKRIARYKDVKNSLEMHLSKVNEQIPCVKLTAQEIENEIIENELRIRIARIRLHNRTESSCVELSNDNVELALFKELRQLNQITTNLQKKRLKAQSSLSSLNKLKSQYKAEIEEKINAIKIDEVECLPLRSSIHYHAY